LYINPFIFTYYILSRTLGIFYFIFDALGFELGLVLGRQALLPLEPFCQPFFWYLNISISVKSKYFLLKLSE
jgi:hypothetical protein